MSAQAPASSSPKASSRVSSSPSGRVPLSAASSAERNLERCGLLGLATKIARDHYVPLDVMLGRTHSQTAVRARRALIIELRQLGMSTPEIGSIINRDHTTVIAALKTATVDDRAVVELARQVATARSGEQRASAVAALCAAFGVEEAP